jgi:hypothetical protein
VLRENPAISKDVITSIYIYLTDCEEERKNTELKMVEK